MCARLLYGISPWRLKIFRHKNAIITCSCSFHTCSIYTVDSHQYTILSFLHQYYIINIVTHIAFQNLHHNIPLSPTEAISHHLFSLNSTLPTLCVSLSGRSCGPIGCLFIPYLPAGEIWEICGYAHSCDMINCTRGEVNEKIDDRPGALTRIHH